MYIITQFEKVEKVSVCSIFRAEESQVLQGGVGGKRRNSKRRKSRRRRRKRKMGER